MWICLQNTIYIVHSNEYRRFLSFLLRVYDVRIHLSLWKTAKQMDFKGDRIQAV